MVVYEAVRWIWIAFGIFWLLAAFAQKRSVRRQSAGSRIFQIVIVLLAIAPFYIPGGRLGPLHARFLPNTLQVQYPGVLVILVGLCFAIWARFILRTNWSGTVTVKENHVLITRGPYAWVRHPIYTGVLLALLGTAIAEGAYVGLFVVALIAIAFWLKVRIEERFMQETFGDRYTAYRQRVKALIPYVI